MIGIAAPGVRHVFLRDMVLQASIGWYPHEHDVTQRVRVNIDLGVEDDADRSDDLSRVVSYETVASAVRAPGIAITIDDFADPRVLLAHVRVEKLDVFPDAAAAGVAILRRRGDGHP